MPISGVDPLLAVAGLAAGYGKIRILHDVSVDVFPGEIVTILGPNGAGKTTLMKAVSGLLTPTAGTIRFAGRDCAGFGPRGMAAAGLAHVIEGHRVFPQLRVIENLMLAGYDLRRPERRTRIEAAIEQFPELGAKLNDRAGSLSGGQQQMLMVAQGLVKQPRLLIMDEPSAGLSPVLVDRVLGVAATLRQRGVAVLLVEQLVEKALRLADRVYAMAQGGIVLQARADEPGLQQRLEQAYLGGSATEPAHA